MSENADYNRTTCHRLMARAGYNAAHEVTRPFSHNECLHFSSPGSGDSGWSSPCKIGLGLFLHGPSRKADSYTSIARRGLIMDEDFTSNFSGQATNTKKEEYDMQRQLIYMLQRIRFCFAFM